DRYAAVHRGERHDGALSGGGRVRRALPRYDIRGARVSLRRVGARSAPHLDGRPRSCSGRGASGEQLGVAVRSVAGRHGGSRHRPVLAVQAVCAALGLAVVLRVSGSVGVRELTLRRGTVRELFRGGTPFLFFGLTVALQSNIDAFFLSRFASTEAVGWYAAAS